MNHYVQAIYQAVKANEPVSPFALHTKVDGSLNHLRAALRVALQTGMVQMTPDFELVIPAGSPADLGCADPSSAPDADGPGSSNGHPTQDPDSPRSPRPASMAHSKCECHPGAQTGSQMPCPHCAIRNGLSSLLRLKDELNKYLLAAHHSGDDKVRPAVCGLLRRVEAARREYEESDKWLRESQQPSTDG